MPTPEVVSSLWDEARLRRPHEQPDKAQRVRAMFDAIAPTYERVNRLLSLGRDASWRRRAVALASVREEDRVLDVACGTGDFARAFAEAGPSLVVGSDFSGNMLARAVGRTKANTTWCRADALRLPFPDASFTVVSCAFGVRNFHGLVDGLSEACRVLRPGGRMVVLEFSMPRSKWAGRVYRFYFHKVLPRLASWLSGDRTGAYSYLPRSVSSFVDSEGMGRAMRDAGFNRVRSSPLSLGIVTVHLACKAEASNGP